MGLDTTPECWSGPYSQFMRWRTWLAAQVGIPLPLMEGFYKWEWEASDLDFDRDWQQLVNINPSDVQKGVMWWDTLKGFRDLGRGISWELINSPLKILLNHSDCDGAIAWHECKSLAIELGKILRRVSDDTAEAGADWRDGRGCYDGNVPALKRFIRGLLIAHKTRQDVQFH